MSEVWGIGSMRYCSGSDPGTSRNPRSAWPLRGRKSAPPTGGWSMSPRSLRVGHHGDERCSLPSDG